MPACLCFEPSMLMPTSSFVYAAVAVIASPVMKTRLFIVSFMMLCLGLSLLAQTQPPVIKSGDTLTISISIEGFSRIVTVRTDGKISLPLLNDVPADGLTALELQRILEGRYARYVKNP